LTIVGRKSSVAISLAPGAVGVAVGTDDTAVAVAVGGSGVGVGVANDKGTAVSVGAGGGGVSVGADHNDPQYKLFETPTAENPTGISSLSSRDTALGIGNLSSRWFGGSGDYWSFARD
jgi:hypothetical protein